MERWRVEKRGETERGRVMGKREDEESEEGEEGAREGGEGGGGGGVVGGDVGSEEGRRAASFLARATAQGWWQQAMQSVVSEKKRG